MLRDFRRESLAAPPPLRLIRQRPQTLRAVPLLLFACFVIFKSTFFSAQFVSGSYSQHIVSFSLLYIPLLTLFLHTLLLFFCRYWVFCLLVLADTVLSVGIASYYEYFGENVDLHTLASTVREFLPLATADTFIVLTPKKAALLLLALTIGECAAAKSIRKLSLRRLWKVLGALVVPFALLGAYKVPFWQATHTLYYDRFIAVHGYYAAFIFDSLFSSPMPGAAEVTRRIKTINRTHPVRRLPDGIVTPGAYRHLITLQVESLDFNVLGHVEEGKAVTPFLNSLRSGALVLKLRPHHTAGSGSSGADYQFLTGRIPIPEYAAYKLPGFDPADTLPILLRRRGILTTVYDGTVKSYWGRAVPYKQMQIARFIDSTSFPEIDTSWGISDELLLSAASDTINKTKDSQLFLLMTLTSHVPFNFVDNNVFSRSDLVGRYFNSINYTDKALRDFVGSLKGRNLFIVFGDHPSGVRGPGYSSFTKGEGFIPGMIFSAQDGRLTSLENSPLAPGTLQGLYDIRSLHYVALGFSTTTTASK